jgi:hypothetical protein
MADALARCAEAALAGEGGMLAPGERHQLQVQVDVEALCDPQGEGGCALSDGPRVPPCAGDTMPTIKVPKLELYGLITTTGEHALSVMETYLQAKQPALGDGADQVGRSHDPRAPALGACDASRPLAAAAVTGLGATKPGPAYRAVDFSPIEQFAAVAG